MSELAHNIGSDRAYCPGCGASLELGAEQTLVTCEYCGTDSKVFRRLRRLEPELPLTPPPKPPVDPTKDYDRWGTEALVWGILNTTDLAARFAMAQALDEWPHANATMAGLLPHYITCMLTAPEALDKAMRGVIGKLVCSDNLKLRHAAIVAGQKFGFANPGSKGLLFALSLGDAGTVKLLLEIAEWAQEKGLPDYCREALIGVQTAIGREARYRHVCNEILLHRIPYVTGQVREWMLGHIRREFDVGYRQPRVPLLQLMQDMASEQPDLLPELARALRPCRGAESPEDWDARLHHLTTLTAMPVRVAALETIGNPPHTLQDTTCSVKVLGPLLDVPELRDPAAAVMRHLLYIGDAVPAPMAAVIEARGGNLPRNLADAWKLRKGR